MSRRAFRERCGKARRARHQRRASLVLARQSIEEYLEPETDGELRRLEVVPVTARSAFYPTANFAELSSDAAAQQMHLPFGVEPQSTSALALAHGGARDESCKSAATLPAGLRRGITASGWIGGRPTSGRFSWARFAYGLLVGSAAAGLALSLLRWALG